MRVAGLANVVYCPLLIYLALGRRRDPLAQQERKEQYNSFEPAAVAAVQKQQQHHNKYERFYDSDDGL